MQMLAKYEKLNLDNQKQVTLFLGKTGWGKSTTINYLDGVSLKINEDGHLAPSDPA
jgi:putative ribosome biogenesis GTPase RsgA